MATDKFRGLDSRRITDFLKMIYDSGLFASRHRLHASLKTKEAEFNEYGEVSP